MQYLICCESSVVTKSPSLVFGDVDEKNELPLCIADCPSDQDHKDFHCDIEVFPYRIYHGNVDVRILNRLKACKLAQQVSLSEALSVQKAEDMEVSFYRDASHALEVSKITGDLIPLLLGVNITPAFRSDMTLLEFVEARPCQPGILRFPTDDVRNIRLFGGGIEMECIILKM